MTMLANAFHTFQATGNREDLSDLISLISPKDTPLYDSIGSRSAQATLVEWQTDTLAAANPDNATLEGETFTAVARTPTNRLSNRCQIFNKMFTVTDTQEIVNKAGRGKESAYQMGNAMAELKRDYEATLFDYGGSASGVAGISTRAARMRTLHAWIADVTTSTGSGANGNGGPGTYVPITRAQYLSASATAAPITEAWFNQILQNVWDQGGRPNAVYVGGGLSKTLAGWATSTSRVWDGSKTVVNAIQVYESMFGQLTVKLERFCGSSLGYIVDEKLWSKATLKPTGLKNIGSRGLGNDFLVWSQWTLEAKNPSGNGMFISG